MVFLLRIVCPRAGQCGDRGLGRLLYIFEVFSYERNRLFSQLLCTQSCIEFRGSLVVNFVWKSRSIRRCIVYFDLSMGSMSSAGQGGDQDLGRLLVIGIFHFERMRLRCRYLRFNVFGHICYA